MSLIDIKLIEGYSKRPVNSIPLVIISESLELYDFKTKITQLNKFSSEQVLKSYKFSSEPRQRTS